MNLFSKEKVYISSGVIISIFSLIVYILTSQQTVMFWDSGEFISCAVKLQVSHPPGAPIYTLLSNIFLNFFSIETKAFGAAIFSAVFASGTIFLLYLITGWFTDKVIKKLNYEDLNINLWLKLSTSGIAALTLTFSNSFWTSATEAEVYTVSTFFTALSFWLVTHWEVNYGKPGNFKNLFLLVFILGLSVGAHLLNLAVVFPIIVLINMRYSTGKLWVKLLISGVVALVAFVVLESFLIKGFLKLCTSVELTFVNYYNLPLNSGFIGCVIGMLITLSTVIYIGYKRRYKIIYIASCSILLFVIGWSSYAFTVIRSNAGTPLSNDTSNPMELLYYIETSQFGHLDPPLVYGPTYASPLNASKPALNADPIWVYSSIEKKYIKTNNGKNMIPNFDKESFVLFPRMYNRQEINVQGYKDWVKSNNKIVEITSLNRTKERFEVPNFGDNFRYFFKFQFGWLNWRYLMWNFVGRQNELLGKGDALAGNWESGINFIDKGRIGDKKERPDYFIDNPTKRIYYGLPFILGIIGIVFLFKKHSALAWVSLIFFLAFSLAITIFINQLPNNVYIRERDYVFLSAYFIFSMWIGLGVLALYHWIKINTIELNKLKIIVVACLLLVPCLMAKEGWMPSDRSDNNFAYKLAKNMLAQCEHEGLVIANGDNVTFPLWYLQEVEGFRKDVRVIDYNLLNLDWYIDKLLVKQNDAPPLNLSLSREFYTYGNTSLFNLDLKLEEPLSVNSLSQKLQKSTSGKKTINSDLFLLDVALENIDTSYIKSLNGKPLPQLVWRLNKPTYDLKDIVLMDLLQQNNFKKAVYFTNTGRAPFYLGLEQHFVNQGLLYEFLPIAPISEKEVTKMVDIQKIKKWCFNDENFDVKPDSEKSIGSENLDFMKASYKPIFYELALAYKIEQKNDSSILVLKRLEKLFPNESVPYGNTLVDAAIIYYELGLIDDWRRVIRIVIDNNINKMNWLTSFNPNHKTITFKSIMNIGNNFNKIMPIVVQRDADLAKELDIKLKQLDMQYKGWVSDNQSYFSE